MGSGVIVTPRYSPRLSRLRFPSDAVLLTYQRSPTQSRLSIQMHVLMH
jgi:hypothetical protein